jgi:hypothetical protein
MHSTLLLEDDYQATVRRAHDRLQPPSSRPEAADAAGCDVQPGGVRASVLESWNRSLDRLHDPAGASECVWPMKPSSSPRSDAGIPSTRSCPCCVRTSSNRRKMRACWPHSAMSRGVCCGSKGNAAFVIGAEAMGFLPGTDWSEEVMGTSAPGLALQSGSPVQISQAEHFAPDVHSWSCSAVPVTHPLTGQVIGIIDVTGGDDAVSSIVLPLLASTAKAAGAELSQLYTAATHGPLRHRGGQQRAHRLRFGPRPAGAPDGHQGSR